MCDCLFSWPEAEILHYLTRFGLSFRSRLLVIGGYRSQLIPFPSTGASVRAFFSVYDNEPRHTFFNDSSNRKIFLKLYRSIGVVLQTEAMPFTYEYMGPYLYPTIKYLNVNNTRRMHFVTHFSTSIQDMADFIFLRKCEPIVVPLSFWSPNSFIN